MVSKSQVVAVYYTKLLNFLWTCVLLKSRNERQKKKRSKKYFFLKMYFQVDQNGLGLPKKISQYPKPEILHPHFDQDISIGEMMLLKRLHRSFCIWYTRDVQILTVRGLVFSFSVTQNKIHLFDSANRWDKAQWGWARLHGRPGLHAGSFVPPSAVKDSLICETFGDKRGELED